MARLRGDGFRRSYIAAPETLHFFTGREQLVQRSFGLDLAIFEHDDMVGAAQSRPPVRHDQARQAFGDFGFWILDFGLRQRRSYSLHRLLLRLHCLLPSAFCLLPRPLTPVP